MPCARGVRPERYERAHFRPRSSARAGHGVQCTNCCGQFAHGVGEANTDRGTRHHHRDSRHGHLSRWRGFDPTNNLIASDRHIRVAIGRDYADVPPTRGVYKGASAVRSELAVAVRIGPVQAPRVVDSVPFTPWMSRDATVPVRDAEAEQQQQQQQ